MERNESMREWRPACAPVELIAAAMHGPLWRYGAVVLRNEQEQSDTLPRLINMTDTNWSPSKLPQAVTLFTCIGEVAWFKSQSGYYD
jgi:hypothetical protein